MTPNLTIQRATIDHTHEVVALVGELFREINIAIGMDAFNFDQGDASFRFKEFIDQGKYTVFIARGQDASSIGLVSCYEGYALSAGGVFGTLAELYVRPANRSQGVGHHLIEQVKAFGQSCHWKLLQVTTPPLPPFDRSLAFYEKEGFVVTGWEKVTGIVVKSNCCLYEPDSADRHPLQAHHLQAKSACADRAFQLAMFW